MAQNRSVFSNGSSSRVRSSPIAIARVLRETDDSSVEEEESDRYSIAHQSMPARLLRAPRLGSVPCNSSALDALDFEANPVTSAVSSSSMLLPPPLALDERAATDSACYGSLRDCHVRGRFMDGPSSYRDPSTGFLRRAAAKQPSLDDIPAVSIGDRIRQGTTKLAHQQQQTSGGLSAVMNQSSPQPAPPTTERPRIVAFSEENHLHHLDSNHSRSPDMLSTSMTGLEIMKRLSRERPPASTASPPPAVPTISSYPEERVVRFSALETLPRDAQGNNSLLNRSTSDPTPQRPVASNAATAAAVPSVPPSPFCLHGGVREGLLGPDPLAFAAALVAAKHSGTATPSSEVTSATVSEYDPNTEGAFDMDLE